MSIVAVAQRLDHGQPVVFGAQRRDRRKKVRYSPTSLSLSDRLLIETPAVTFAPSALARARAADIAVEILAAW
jgi:hypothetical protein